MNFYTAPKRAKEFINRHFGYADGGMLEPATPLKNPYHPMSFANLIINGQHLQGEVLSLDEINDVLTNIGRDLSRPDPRDAARAVERAVLKKLCRLATRVAPPMPDAPPAPPRPPTENLTTLQECFRDPVYVNDVQKLVELFDPNWEEREGRTSEAFMGALRDMLVQTQRAIWRIAHKDIEDLLDDHDPSWRNWRNAKEATVEPSIHKRLMVALTKMRAKAESPYKANPVIEAVKSVATTPSPNTLNMQGYDAQGNTRFMSTQSCFDLDAAHRVISAALLLDDAGRRGVGVNDYLVGNIFITTKPVEQS